MAEIKDCLHHPEAKRHFINLRNIRLEIERENLNAKLNDSRARLAAQGIRRSGAQELEAWQFKEAMLERLALGYMQDALDTCKLYGIQVTRPLRDCLLAAASDLLVAQYKSALQSSAQGISEVKIPLHVRAQRAGHLRGNQFPVMKDIRVLIENARVEDERARTAMAISKDKPDHTHNYYTQQNTVQTGVMNVSQTGSVTSQQLLVGRLNEIRPALADMRAFFKAHGDSLDLDEYAGLMAGAEKASIEGNESKAVAILKQVPEKAWDIGKAVIPQVLMAFLKAHGIIPA